MHNCSYSISSSVDTFIRYCACVQFGLEKREMLVEKRESSSSRLLPLVRQCLKTTGLSRLKSVINITYSTFE